MRKILNRVEEQQVIKRYKDGATLKQVAATYRIHYCTIGRIITRYKIKRPERIGAHSYRLAEHQKEKIIIDFQAGIPLPELAEKYNLAVSSIHIMLKRRGIIRPRRSHGTWKFSEEQKQNIEKEYRSGASSYVLADKYKTTDSNILALLNRRGVKTRTISETRDRWPVNHDSFSILTDESVYWIGFLMADGNIYYQSGKYPHVSLALQNADIEHVIKFKLFTATEAPVVTRKTSLGGPVSSVTIGSLKMAQDLASWGVTPRKSLTAKAHDDLVDNQHFWRGVIDGDGSLYISNERWPRPRLALCGSKLLMQQFADFVHRSIGMHYMVRPNKNIWSVELSGTSAINMINILYDQCGPALNRKLNIAKKILLLPPRRKWLKNITRIIR